MTEQEEKIQEALRRVQSARRTLALAREVQGRAFDVSLVSDVVASLTQQLTDAEFDAAKLIGARGAPLGEGYVSVAVNDRRANVRPSFRYRPRFAMAVRT